MSTATQSGGGSSIVDLTVLPTPALREPLPPLFVRLAAGLVAPLRRRSGGARRPPLRAAGVPLRGHKHGAAAATPAVVPPPASPIAPPAPRAVRRDAAKIAHAAVLPDPCCGEWRAWRETGMTLESTVLHVIGACTLPAGAGACRIVLQEAILSSCQQQNWGGGPNGMGGSPLLLLERVIIPPPFGTVGDLPSEPHMVLISYRKEERHGVTMNVGAAPPVALRPRYTHVTILPDGVTLPIRDL